MTVEQTLARVEADLAVGDVAMARTRLTSLLQSLPRELAARERLAEVYRLEDNRVEAGRWSYLAAERIPEETQAFESACGRDPVRVMRALRWRGPEETAATEIARERLRDVRARAQAKAKKELDWSDAGRGTEGSAWQDGVALGCLGAAFVLLALAVIGLFTVIEWFTPGS